MTNEPELLTHVAAGVATLTLNRPDQYNALSESLLARLRDSVREAGDDPNTRVVVIAGNGRAFCAGHDLKQMRANPSRQYQIDLFALCSQMMLTIADIPKPVVARVHGAAVAAGCQLVAACDLAIAARSARFAVSGINLGIFCGTPSVPLGRNVPRKRALEMLLLGEQIDADTAAEWHLVNRSVDDDQLDSVLDSWTTVLADKPVDAVSLGKGLWRKQIDQPLATAYDTATAMMAENMMREETQRGIDEFIQKRGPTRPTSTSGRVDS